VVRARGATAAEAEKKRFWRGFFPLLAWFSLASLTPQVDIAMLARAEVHGPAAFVLLMRVALFELVLMNAMGAVASIIVAKAHRAGDASRAARQVWTLAAVVGAGVGGVGFFAYPTLVQALMGKGEIGALASAAAAWHCASAPFRFLAGVGGYTLHGMGRGAWVFRWGVCEAGVKAIGNYVFMTTLGFGFSGCFMSGLLVALLSSSLYRWRLGRLGLAPFFLPSPRFVLDYLRAAAWEAERLLSPQLAVAAALALFALPWLGGADLSRLEAYAAGQMLIMLTLTPFIALTRFLALRLAGRAYGEVAALVVTLSRQGLPFIMTIALILFLEGDWLGSAVYGQRGPWWSALVAALATSLPLRYVANVMRGALQATGRFASVAAADGLAPWAIGLPLIALGLRLDRPDVAYMALIAPEIISALWMWRRLAP
jgi:Na+-driven multidrug efflux pump